LSEIRYPKEIPLKYANVKINTAISAWPTAIVTGWINRKLYKIRFNPDKNRIELFRVFVSVMLNLWKSMLYSH